MKIAIKANSDRGEEIISLLESLGGINSRDWKGNGDLYVYYIDKNNEIQYEFLPKDYKLYTLEEFEKEFPFKIGDIVTIIGIPDFPKTITKMEWDRDEILYSFEGLVNTWFGAKALKKFEMKEERNITLTLDKAREWYKKGGELKEIALQAFTEKELTKVDLPKTWEEFCKRYPIKKDESYINSESKILSFTTKTTRRDWNHICPSQKSAEAHLAMIQLEQLRDCWRQGNIPQQLKYKIRKVRNIYTVVYGAENAFLSFCDQQTAEEFLECFRDLIEKAGDLI